MPKLLTKKGYLTLAHKTALAVKVLSARGMYTDAVKRGTWTGKKPVPPLPTKAESRIVADYRAWCDAVNTRTDEQWLRAISYVEYAGHEHSMMCQLIWWELCEKVDLNDAEWRAHFQWFDYDAALLTDLDAIGYKMHRAGLHPFTAFKISKPCSDRTKWAAHHALDFQCPSCDEITSGYTTPPQRCKACGQRIVKLIQVS